MLPKLEQEIRNLHNLVGNAIMEGRHIVVENGSCKFIEDNTLRQIRVVHVEGDAHAYDHDDQPYIEMVTSPNNINGELMGPIVNKANGMLVHDLAY
ncbi:hypothetical protein SASPL_131097 [Salvia splendens]|uniref:Alliinase C-terminal domain-containing protein n=1 Tax=Salvia splendens TaxID=180675 RepID=A0A8X8X8G4_SALSN|nr:hypothetical protein SASPL_131097 [Salvia splendens]